MSENTLDPDRPAGADARPVRLTSFWHDLPREGRLLLSVVVFEFLGTGLVIPFLVVYLHEIRGFALSDVGWLIGLEALVGFAIVGTAGTVIDRLGARLVVITTIVLAISADVVEGFAKQL